MSKEKKNIRRIYEERIMTICFCALSSEKIGWSKEIVFEFSAAKVNLIFVYVRALQSTRNLKLSLGTFY